MTHGSESHDQEKQPMQHIAYGSQFSFCASYPCGQFQCTQHVQIENPHINRILKFNIKLDLRYPQKLHTSKVYKYKVS